MLPFLLIGGALLGAVLDYVKTPKPDGAHVYWAPKSGAGHLSAESSPTPGQSGHLVESPAAEPKHSTSEEPDRASRLDA